MDGQLLRRRDVFSWCLYDWANSAFVTSVTVVVLPIYFLTLTPAGKGPVTVALGPLVIHTNGDALWMYFTSLYMLAAGLAAPILGAIADYARGKRRFLALCVVGGAAFTGMLALVPQGGYALCGWLYVGAAFLWGCGNLFYDALLPELAGDEEEMDAISSAGYAVGYIGGGLLLGANLAMITNPRWFGLADARSATRAVFITVACWWAAFSIPVLLYVRDKALARPAPRAGHPIIAGFTRLVTTLRHLRRYRQLLRMLVAFILYDTGVGTVIVVAAVFGHTELGLSDGTLIACVLMIQFVGFPATFAFIALARRLGARSAVLVGLVVYVGVVLFAFRMQSATEFWILGALVALVQGGTQALSRSLYGSMIPEGRSAEFFGFFSIFNKVGSFAGPLCFGWVRDMTDSSRLAILFLATFFVLGGVMLLAVNVAEGRAAAQTADEPAAGAA